MYRASVAPSAGSLGLLFQTDCCVCPSRSGTNATALCRSVYVLFMLSSSHTSTHYYILERVCGGHTLARRHWSRPFRVCAPRDGEACAARNHQPQPERRETRFGFLGFRHASNEHFLLGVYSVHVLVVSCERHLESTWSASAECSLVYPGRFGKNLG